MVCIARLKPRAPVTLTATIAAITSVRISAARNENRPGQVAEPRTLTAVRVKIRRIEPGPEPAIERRPLAVDAGVPCRVAIAALVDARQAKGPLVRNPQALRGGA